MEVYEGVLSIDKMGPVEKRAYKSWKDQGSRCSSENNPRFYCYGAKGIKRIYGPREFIAWYLSEFSKRESWKCPQVDRIDSNGNYELGNVQLIERSENVKKRNDEHGNPMESFRLSIQWPDGAVKEFPSIREASRETGICRKSIQSRLRNSLKRKPKDDLIITMIR